MKISMEEFIKSAAEQCDCDACQANRKIKNPFKDKTAPEKDQSFSEAMAEESFSDEEDESMAESLAALEDDKDGDALVEGLAGIVMVLSKRLGYKRTSRIAHVIWTE